MENTRVVKLLEPLAVGGSEITEVTVRRPTIGDEEDALQHAIQMKRGKNDLTVEMCLLARVSRLPFDALRSMHGGDYAQIRAAVNGLNGREKPEEDENPTMRTTA